MSACLQCGDRGLIRVAYQSGEPFDLAICNCRVGQVWRGFGEAFIRQRLQVGPEHRIARLADFSDALDVFDAMDPLQNVPDFVAAGKMPKKRAKL